MDDFIDLVVDKRFAYGVLPVPLQYSRLSRGAKMVWAVLQGYGTRILTHKITKSRRLLRKDKARSKGRRRQGKELSDFEMRTSMRADAIRNAIKELVHAGCLKIRDRPGYGHQYFVTMPAEEDWMKGPYAYVEELTPPKWEPADAPKTVGVKGYKRGTDISGTSKGTGKAGNGLSKNRYRDPKNPVPLIKNEHKNEKIKTHDTGSRQNDGTPDPRRQAQEERLSKPIAVDDYPTIHHAILADWQQTNPGLVPPLEMRRSVERWDRDNNFTQSLADKVPKKDRQRLKVDPGQLDLL